MSQKSSFRPSVMRYFTEHEGQRVWVEDLAEAIGCTILQAQSCVSNMRNIADEFPITTIQGGHVWRYEGEVAAANGASTKGLRVFEEIKILKDGSILIQDQNGDVYRANELV